MRRFLLLLIAMLTITPVHAATDWSATASRKTDGAFVQGNPAAKVKLVEFFSLTCPHCAKFEGEAIAPLTAKYIKAGLVSYEVRHALRDAFDLSASLLARCEGPAAFFAAMPPLYAAQEQWMTKAEAWSKTAPDPKDISQEKLLVAVAQGAGLDQFFAARGVPAAKANACLTSKADRDLLVAMANDAWKQPGFPGTPAFTINGVLQKDISSWAELDAKLGAALKAK